MTVLDYILCGIERELSLERELGVRVVECDREVLVPVGEVGGQRSEVRGQRSEVRGQRSEVGGQRSEVRGQRSEGGGQRSEVRGQRSEGGGRHYDFVFLHEGPLSADGAVMLGKIVSALEKTPETAPLITDGELPVAGHYVVLGEKALAKWFPKMRYDANSWVNDGHGKALYVTYSPEYILRFGVVTPTVKKIKVEMWNGLKTLMKGNP